MLDQPVYSQKFAPLKALFETILSEDKDRGARFCVLLKGQIVFDMWGGTADREGTKPFDQQSLSPIFSTTKAVTALMMARLVERRLIGYETPIADVWPEFGAAGKSRLTLGQILSHQGGLCGLNPAQEPQFWMDRQAVLDQLCAQAPLWPVGQGSGYHPITGGYILGEVFRRVDGRTLGTALNQDFDQTVANGVIIGLKPTDLDRVAVLQKPNQGPDLGRIDQFKQLAFLEKGSSPGRAGAPDWQAMEIPSQNGHATARGLAHLLSILANNGVLGSRQYLSTATIKEAICERVYGHDRVLPFTLSWGGGFLRNRGLKIYGPNENSIGHSGWGGSCVMADPHLGLSCAYVMTRQSHYLINDPRSMALIDCAYQCL